MRGFFLPKKYCSLLPLTGLVTLPALFNDHLSNGRYRPVRILITGGAGFIGSALIRHLLNHTEHQVLNLCLAISMLAAQDKLAVSEAAILAGAKAACWPARMQHLGPGPLTALAPKQTVWLDGGHNRSAGAAIAAHFDGPLHLVIGMIEGKDPRAIVDPLGERLRSLIVIPVPGHEYHPVEAFGPAAQAADNVEDALRRLPADGYPILIAGSLYLVGEARAFLTKATYQPSSQ